MTAEPIFDIRKHVRRRIWEYIFIVPMMGMALIGLGIWVLPDDFVFEASRTALERVDAWVIFGLGLIAAGIFNFLKAIILSFRAIKSSGEWHFRLTSEDLLWQVPKHPFGPEVGFETKLSAIKEIEFRTITAYEERDVQEYWVHFRDGTNIQLMDYTGFTVSSLVSKIQKAGVHYTETRIEK